MNKLQKRLSKLVKHPQNCIIFGSGLGILAEVSQIFKTVFVFDSQRPELKAKNLVYRENDQDFSNLTDVSVIFFDLSKISHLQSVLNIASKDGSKIVIEGNDAIGRELSGPLYKFGFECTSLQGFFHIWEKKK